MTKTKLLLSLVLATGILGISSTAIQPEAFADDDEDNTGSYLDIIEFESEVDDGTLEIEIKTGGDIPVSGFVDGSPVAFGYGVITAFTTIDVDGEDVDVPENVLAITGHICAADSTLQSNIDESTTCPGGETIGVLDALFSIPDTNHDGPEVHPHILDLTIVQDGSPCEDINAGIEVDVARTLDTQNNISPTTYDLEVDENEIELEDVPINENNVLDGNVAAVASFTITPFATDNVITNLCITDLTVTPIDNFNDDDN